MTTSYGHSDVGVGHYSVGEVRVVSITAPPAIFPHLRFDLQWTLGSIQRAGEAGTPVDYQLVDYGGDLHLGRNGPLVAHVIRPGPGLPLQALPYVRTQQGALVADLDGARIERIEQFRDGRPLELTMNLWPRIEMDGTTTDARIGQLHLRVPREDWLAVLSKLSEVRTELLEIKYHLTHSEAFEPSLEELARAQKAVDRGEYDGAVVVARKAVSLLEEAVGAKSGGDLKSQLETRTDARHAKLYSSLVARAKDMGNIKAHRARSREYSRAEAQFAVRFATILIEVLAALTTDNITT